jgi:hypothetical protein
MPAAEARVQDLLDAIDEVRNHMQELSETLRQVSALYSIPLIVPDNHSSRPKSQKHHLSRLLQTKKKSGLRN